MNIVRRFASNRPCCRVFHVSSTSFKFSQTADKNEAKNIILNQLNPRVNVPKAKDWSKTAVLEALASTVKSEVTVGHQELHSPEFWNYGRQPVEQKHKLRKSGRAAANYVIDNYNHLFQHDFDAGDITPWIDTTDDEHFTTLDPPDAAESIDNSLQNESGSSAEKDEAAEGGLESEMKSENSGKKVMLESSVESFQKLLDLKKIEQAADMFHQLLDDKVDIPQEALMQFLGLVAFYKGSDELRESIDELPLRAYTYRSLDEKDETMDLVTKVFDRLPWKNNSDLVQAYILTLGSLTRDRALKVVSLFENHVAGKMKVSIHVYNQILLSAITLQHKKRYGPAKRVIDEMDKQNVAPDYHTFCLFFRVLPFANMSASKILFRFSSLLSDMNSFGIECGPDIFSAMITVTARHIHHDKDMVLNAIFDFMAGRNLRYQHPIDLMSYTRILKIYSKDVDIVKKVMDIVQYGNNSLAVACSSLGANSFYNTFFDILRNEDSIENVFYYYRTLIPARTYLTTKGRQNFIRYIRAKKRPEYLPIMYAGFSTSRAYVSNVVDVLMASLGLLEHADEDTKTQLKHIAMMEIQFCTVIIFESEWSKIMRLSFELVLLLSTDLPDVMTCFNKFLTLRTIPDLGLENMYNRVSLHPHTEKPLCKLNLRSFETTDPGRSLRLTLDKLLTKFEDMGKEHKSSAVPLALEQYHKKFKKSVRQSQAKSTYSKNSKSPTARLDGLPLDKIEN